MTDTSLTLGEVADRFGLECRGDRARALVGLATLGTAGASHISFLANTKYKKFLQETRAGAVIVTPELRDECPVDCLVATDPYLAYAQVSQLFDNAPLVPIGIHASAVVAASARIDATAAIGPLCVIGEHAQIGANVVIAAGSIVDAYAVIGADSRLHPRATVLHNVSLGRGCAIHSGAVIGSDGFGYAPVTVDGRRGQWERIAQLGSVRLGRNVSVGANTTIDRGAIEDTVIADNVIIDNQVQIAHNVNIGEGTAIAGSAGIAGSAVIGAHCMIGGAVGIAGHLTIADGVQVQGGGRVIGSVDKPGVYNSGTGLLEARDWRRQAVRFGQLDDLYKRVVELEKQLKDKP
jgi:UDP-3-O-[3-hydroxymyristoyl] glucosamine N-acyltransferase